jgi:hypothetical protein
MTPDLDWEDRFNKWYDTHYIPSRMVLPGFISAQRYRDAERPSYLVVYEMDSLAPLRTPEYMKLRAQPNVESKWMLTNVTEATRYTGDQIFEQRQAGLNSDPLDAPVLVSVYFSVPDGRADEFNRWYNEEHVPMLLQCKDWLMCRRFAVDDGDPEPWTHLALHYLASEAALESPERAAANETPWRKKLAEEQWFRARLQVYQRHGNRFLHKAAAQRPATRKAG